MHQLRCLTFSRCHSAGEMSEFKIRFVEAHYLKKPRYLKLGNRRVRKGGENEWETINIMLHME